jgi:hypothetical protein
LVTELLFIVDLLELDVAIAPTLAGFGEAVVSGDPLRIFVRHRPRENMQLPPAGPL